MGAFDFQLGVVDEVTFNTAPVVSRFFEYNSPVMPIKAIAGRTEGNPLRVGSRARRQNRAIPFFDHGEGTLPFDAMDKGLGFWLKHMLPHVVTTGAGPYVHTATEGTSSESMGKSFAAQVNVPFHPSGTDQAFTFSGGKVTQWSLENTVKEMLKCELGVWFAGMTTATAKAAASYPASMNDFHWGGCVVSIGGGAFDVTDIKIEVNLNPDVERPALRGNTAAKEPTPGPLEVSWALEADFDSLAQWNRVHATTPSGLSASISAVWTNGASSLTATIPAGRFDEIEHGGDEGAVTQSFSGIGEFDGTNSPITLAYVTTDATP